MSENHFDTLDTELIQLHSSFGSGIWNRLCVYTAVPLGFVSPSPYNYRGLFQISEMDKIKFNYMNKRHNRILVVQHQNLSGTGDITLFCVLFTKFLILSVSVSFFLLLLNFFVGKFFTFLCGT